MDLLEELDNHKKHNINKKQIFLGYPLNLSFDYSEIHALFDTSLNLLGSPFDEGSRYKYERNIIKYFGDLYKFPNKKVWGYVTSGGSEANMYGLYLARERLKNPFLLFSQETHYSIEKAAKMLKIPFETIKTQSSGEIDYLLLEKAVKRCKNRDLIININIGSTMRGAIDDLDAVQRIFQANKIKDYHIHVDAALFGGYLPFLDKKLTKEIGSVADSITISGHKFFGTPFPCGIFLTKKNYLLADNFEEYTKSHDVTLLGSRNGHSAVLLWYLINKKGAVSLEKEAKSCINNAKYLEAKLKMVNYPVWRNKLSNIVYFDKPPQGILNKWILAVDKDIAHVVTMQHVTKQMLDEFIKDIYAIMYSI